MSHVKSNITTNDSSTDSSSQFSAIDIESKIFFYSFILLNVPSFACNVGLLIHYFLYQRKQPTQCFFTFTVVCLLIVSIFVTGIDLPFIAIPQLKGTSYVGNLQNPQSFCIFFHFFDTTLYVLELWLVALTSYERYLLIFYSNITQKNKVRKYLFHYFPVILIGTFLIIFLFYLHVLFPCESKEAYDPISKSCNYPCFYRRASPHLLSVALIISYTLPVFITIIFDLLLIGHVVYQKQHILKMLSVNSTNANKRQTMQETWKRTKKLFIQFLPLTILFALTDMPWAIRQALRSIFPDFLNGISVELEICLAYLTVLYQLLIVFPIFLNQQELRSKFRQLMKKLWMKVQRTIFGINAVAPFARVATVGTASYLH